MRVREGRQSNLVLAAPPEDYARAVVGNALSWWPRSQYWYGNNWFKIWLSTFFWHTISVSKAGCVLFLDAPLITLQDSALSKTYGLDLVRAKVQKLKGN